jgi:hypothetical protein
MTNTQPRRFHLQRDHDVTGVSGTGRVADGIVWSDGTVSVRWLGDRPSTVFWDDLAHAVHVHGHGGHTRIVLLDSPEARLARIAEAHSEHLGDGGFTFGDCNECGHVWPCPTYAWATAERDPLATWDPADDEPQLEPCTACLLPKGDAPVERCIVEGPHDTHVTAMGRRWTDAHLTSDQP